MQSSTPNHTDFNHAHAGTPRVVGLDTLRGVLALAVFLFHGAMPPVMLGYDATDPVLRKLNAVLNWSINGQLVVVGFFFISGFCIHYPYEGRPMRVASFYTARLLRLAVPAAAAIALAWVCGFRPKSALVTIPIWTLYCELAYYLCYPVLLPLLRRGFGPGLLVGSYLFAGMVLALSPSYLGYHEYGFLGTTVIGLPVWLLGASLAQREHMKPSSAESRHRLIVLRLAVFGFGAVTQVAANIQIVGLGWTLTAGSPLLYFWVREEIAHFRRRAPRPAFETVGAWSYSLYLVHLACLFFLTQSSLGRFGGNVAWVLTFFLTMLCAFAFYWLVEEPSHRLSQRAGRWVAAKESNRAGVLTARLIQPVSPSE